MCSFVRPSASFIFRPSVLHVRFVCSGKSRWASIFTSFTCNSYTIIDKININHISWSWIFFIIQLIFLLVLSANVSMLAKTRNTYDEKSRYKPFDIGESFVHGIPKELFRVQTWYSSSINWMWWITNINCIYNE